MLDITYRIWLIKSLTRLFVPPLASVALAVRVLDRVKGVHLHPAYQVALYVLSLPVYWTSWIQLTRWDESRRAKKHGAKLPPIIEGKKLGNIDILKRQGFTFGYGFTEDYAGLIVDELLDEAGVDTARLSLLWADRLITRDHDVLKYMLSTGFNDFEKGPQSIMRLGSFLGTGIFASDGERAKFHRAIARPYFARERISDYECFGRHTEKLLAIIQAHSSSDTPIDVQDVFSRFTMDAAEEFLFGNRDFATLDLPLPKPGQTEESAKGSALEGVFGKFVQAFEQGQTNCVGRLGKGNYGWTIVEFFKDKQVPIVRTMEDYLNPLVMAAIARKKEMESRGEESKEHESFLDHLAASTDDVALIKDQLRNVLLAARDTTAQLLSFTCYCLALKPEIIDRLRQEILSAYGDSTVPTYDDLKKQKYLRAVLDETLRLFPPVPVNVRHSKHDVVIPTREGGLYIPRGDFTCIYSTISIQRRKDLWGEDANEYNPERWMDPERARKIASDPFMFLPFNGGPRICLGQQFAYNEASFVLVRLLQKFSQISLAQNEAAPTSALPPASWKEAKGRKPVEKVWPKTALTLYTKFPKRSSPGINYASLGRTALLSTIGYTGATLLWSIAVVFAPIADVTSIWATGAFWTYTFSVVISLRNGHTTGRPAYKWESRKLVAVVMAAAGVTAVVYGGHTKSKLSSGPNILTATFVGAGATLFGDTLALCSALCSASWNVWYDRCIALPEEPKCSQPPTPQSSDDADQEPTEYQPLRSDDTERVLLPIDSLSPYPPHTLPFGLHENFFTWLVGFTTLSVLWIPLYLAYALKLGPPLELPPNPRIWLLVGLTAAMNLIYNAGSLILLGIWGPVLMTVGNLLNVALVLAADALFRKGMETITAGTLLGSAMIVGAFGILASEGLK
ncbi:hypothetical protein FRC05_005356 [Tulasnella sp. 425]|nr:hypothetical protein FRC05_005356 [Tulasnella sp. 425]